MSRPYLVQVYDQKRVQNLVFEYLKVLDHLEEVVREGKERRPYLVQLHDLWLRLRAASRILSLWIDGNMVELDGWSDPVLRINDLIGLEVEDESPHFLLEQIERSRQRIKDLAVYDPLDYLRDRQSGRGKELIVEIQDSVAFWKQDWHYLETLDALETSIREGYAWDHIIVDLHEQRVLLEETSRSVLVVIRGRRAAIEDWSEPDRRIARLIGLEAAGDSVDALLRKIAEARKLVEQMMEPGFPAVWVLNALPRVARPRSDGADE